METKEDNLAGLSAHAPTLDTRDCLRIYNPQKNTKQLKTDLNRCPKETIIATLEYLNITGYEAYTKPASIIWLICRIQNLLPDICQICEEPYCLQKDEVALLICEICVQGCHNVCILKSRN